MKTRNATAEPQRPPHGEVRIPCSGGERTGITIRNRQPPFRVTLVPRGVDYRAADVEIYQLDLTGETPVYRFVGVGAGI